uniref:Uncharacterized protein n=1 Tax=Arundo donax TaxID=35708 RepID=A0A0A9BKB1_ARUDO
MTKSAICRRDPYGAVAVQQPTIVALVTTVCHAGAMAGSSAMASCCAGQCAKEEVCAGGKSRS